MRHSGEILESATGRLILDELLEEITEKLQAGEQISVEDYSQDHPELENQLSKLLPGMQMLAELGHASSDSESPSHSSIDSVESRRTTPGQLGDFRILQEIGRGGMGVVYEAEQISIGRRVALKVLPFAAMLDKQQLNRFKNEARAAGTLDHPNIVAVHSVGTERGVHYYAMQLVEGQSLAEVIAERRKGEPERDSQLVSGNEDPTVDHDSETNSPRSSIDTRPVAALSTVPESHTLEYLHTVAQLGIQAAEALDHAHQNGIVHRDVKPGNLMVDSEGKLYVTDFGLARIEADAGMTMTGDLLGTLRYMSPEQALAKRVVADHRTDIYSLGATLYELLALQPAYQGCDRQELLKQIAFEEPKKLRQLNSRIPVDLETIVAKAMEKNSSDRYETAKVLSDDLQRFIDNQPIQAQRVTRTEHLYRWCRNNPTIAVLLGVIALLATLVAIVTSIGYTKTITALAQVEAQKQQVVEERDRAERHYRAARDAVDRMLTTTALEMDNVPHSNAIRRKLLEDALEFYEEFLQEKSSDPSVRYGTALAYKRVGEIRHDLGDREEAKKAYREAVRLLEKLVEDYPNEASYLEKLARCVSELGYVSHLRDDQASLKAKQLQLDLLHRLVSEHPAHPEYQRQLANAHTLLALSLTPLERMQEVLVHHRKALEIWTQVQNEHPDLPEDPETLAFMCHWYGVALVATNQLEEAEQQLLKASSLREQSLATHPGSRDFRFRLAYVKEHLGRLYSRLKRLKEADTNYQQAIDLCEQLVENFPDEVDYLHRLAGLKRYRGHTLLDRNLLEEAEQRFREAVELREAIFQTDQQDPSNMQLLANVSYELGLLLYMVDELDEEATSAFRRTQQLYETYLENHADDQQTIDALANFLSKCPAIQFQNPKRAAELIKVQLQESPRNSGLWGSLGTAYYAGGDWEQAVDALHKAIELDDDNHPADRLPLAICQWHLGQLENARKSYEQAVEYVKKHKPLSLEIRLLQKIAADLQGIQPEEKQEETP